MKKIITIFGILLCFAATAQKDTPGKLFVTVVDTGGKIMARQKVTLSVEYEPANEPRVVHTEKFLVTTDARGMATLIRGKGVERTGTCNSNQAPETER